MSCTKLWCPLPKFKVIITSHSSFPFQVVYGSFFLSSIISFLSPSLWESGWSGGAMALGNLPVPGRPTIWMTVGQGHTALAVGAGGGCMNIFTLIYPFSSLSPSLWETARYRLKYSQRAVKPKTTNQPTVWETARYRLRYCLKGLLSPIQPTNHPINGPI